MAKLKILICGGGISGNAIALLLSRQGHDVTVVERFSSLRDTGLQVDIRGFGIDVLKRLGLEKDFRAKAVQEEGLQVVNSAGKAIAYFPANRSGKGLQSFTTDYEIMRGDLCRLLYDAAKDRTKYLFGVSVNILAQRDDFVDVSFSDGDRARYDLVIGADGQGSRTRKLMLGSERDDPIEPLGVHIGYFTVPEPMENGEQLRSTFYLAKGQRLVFTRRHTPSSKQVYLAAVGSSKEMENIRKGDTEEEKKALRDIFQGAGWLTDHILESLDKSTDFYCERLSVVRLDAWSSGHVVLVGDAAYCPSATTGMGTTSSLVGAYILAGEIGKHCAGTGSKDELLTALAEYDRKFRPFMSQVQHGITRDEVYWRKIPTSTLGIAILHFVLAVASLLRVDALAKYLLREDVQNWILPEYEDDGTGSV
ncbi:hypotheticall protein [Colletotrichum siamense]|nr:hypotheticall protein [Colletotrichum siamense]